MEIDGNVTNIAAVGSRDYRSADDAQPWPRADTGLANGAAAFLTHDGSTSFAVVDFMDNTHTFFRSGNLGTSWDPIEENANTFVSEIEVVCDWLFAARTDGLWWTPRGPAAVQAQSLGQIKA